MKKSQLQAIIQEEVKAALQELDPGAVRHFETTNPELDRLVNSFINGLAKKYGYGELDACYALFDSLKRLHMLDKSIKYMPGLSEVKAPVVFDILKRVS